LLRAGKRGGRRAAAAALMRFNGADANAAAQRALTDEDDQVQAAIVKQLRQRGIPGALNRVIDLLDSPRPAVCEAARQSLSEFDFDRYLAAYDLLDEEIRRSTGLLVRKINPNALDSLRNELGAKARTRRLRALGVAVAMGVIVEIRDTIIDLLSDEDHLVRAEAARALGHCPHPAARAALREAIHDRSVPVQEAVMQSLERLDAPPDAAGGA
jgi:HEAT repeat protein